MSRPANIFELLTDENDTEVKKSAPSSQPKAQTPQQKTPAAAQTQKKTEQKSDRNAAGEGKGNKDRPPRQQGERPAQRQGQRSEVSGASAGDFEKTRSPRSRGGDSRERKEKQAEREEKPGQRIFDRRSGTGRGKENKKNGGGRGNWGTPEDDKKAQEEVIPTEAKETTEQTANAESKPAVEASTTETTQQPEQKSTEDEEDAKLKTLADYLKEKKVPQVTLPPPRTVEDNNAQWAKFTPLKRDEEPQPTKKSSKKEGETKEESGKKTIPADQVLKFTEGSPKGYRGSERGGRGGRGGKGGRGGPSGRGGPRGAPAPNFKDSKAFPSLSPATKA